MRRDPNSEQKPIVSSGLYTHHPKFPDLMPEILDIFVAHGEAYTPDRVSLGEAHRFRNVSFSLDRLDEFHQNWKDEKPGRAIWSFSRESHAGLVVLVADNLSNYGTVLVSVRRKYLANGARMAEYLAVLKELCAVLDPMYGNVFVAEMLQKNRPQMVNGSSGLDLKRGIPDIFWANFLGPEYVEMFGTSKLFSAPFYSVEHLPHGGVLLLLSPSPIDYLDNSEFFNRRRVEIKKHLGLNAFQTDDQGSQVATPQFRFETEWEAERARRLEARLKTTSSSC